MIADGIKVLSASISQIQLRPVACLDFSNPAHEEAQRLALVAAGQGGCSAPGQNQEHGGEPPAVSHKRSRPQLREFIDPAQATLLEGSYPGSVRGHSPSGGAACSTTTPTWQH